MRLHFLVWVAFFAVPAALFADSSFTPQYKPTLQIYKCSGAIQIDGELDDPGWRAASVAVGFAENDPGDQIKPPVDSRALVTYDDRRLYIAFLAFDNPRTVRVNLRDRDNIFQDDYFGIMLDTYGDASGAYELYVNPIGIQGDLRMLPSGEEDLALDLVWESRGLVTDSGYQVEIAIPFSSLRFPEKPDQEWRVNFWRDHQRDVRRRYSWAAIDRDEPCFICQFGTLKGISGIKPGSRLDLLPNITALQQGSLREREPDGVEFHNQSAEAEVAMNAKYSVSTNATAEITVNPDFSQVESDATQIDVNSSYALYYSERRPFFQEGSDLFSTPFSVVYTRAISDPELAGKFTGTFGRTSVALLAARDERTPLLVPLADRTRVWSGGNSTSTIVRVKQALPGNSHIGTILTDRRLDDGGSGTVFGHDFQFTVKRNYQIRGQILASRTTEPEDLRLSPNAGSATFDRGKHTVAFDGEQLEGLATYTHIQADKRHWYAMLSYHTKSPTFRTDNGFVTRNDTKEFEGYTQYHFRPNGKFLLTWTPDLSVGRVWNYDGQRIDEWLVPEISVQFTRQTQVSANYVVSRELFRGVYFPGIRRFRVGVDSRFCSWLILGGAVQHGHVIARSDWLERPVLGHGTDLELYTTLKPTKQLVIQQNYDFSVLDHPDTALNLYRVYVIRSRISYQFTREWFLRLVIEYAHGGEYIDKDVEKPYRFSWSGLRIEPLLSYKLNPFTIFYIGSTHGFGEESPEDVFRRSDQKFFAKLQYLIRI